MLRQAAVRADLQSALCLVHAKGNAEVPSCCICRLLSAEDGLTGAVLMVSMSQPWTAAALGSAWGAAVSAACSSVLAWLRGASTGTSPSPHCESGKRSR